MKLSELVELLRTELEKNGDAETSAQGPPMRVETTAGRVVQYVVVIRHSQDSHDYGDSSTQLATLVELSDQEAEEFVRKATALSDRRSNGKDNWFRLELERVERVWSAQELEDWLDEFGQEYTDPDEA